MTAATHFVLTPHQREIARAICAVIDGCDHGDAFAAIVSVCAGTINHGAGCRHDALFVAEAMGEQLVALVEMGQDDLLELEAP